MVTRWEGELEFRVLGPIEVRLDGSPIDIGGPRQRRLLAALLISRGQVVGAETLAERVWDDDERPEGALQAIRTYVSRVRRALTDAGAPGDEILRTEPPGYRLTIGPDQIDEHGFTAALADIGSTGASPQDRLASIEAALDAWRGLPFAELSGVPWADAAAAPLLELHTVAQEERAAARLELGAHAEVVADLERLASRDPLRSRPVELLALALVRSNREIHALRVIEELRRNLAEVGLSLPAPIAELDGRIAAQDPSLLVVEAPTEQLRGYELAERIGEGAFSLVYRGVQPAVGREVAIKQIRSELANRPEFIRRFEAEAHTVAALEHPFIVPLYDFWREPGAAFLVMRWLRGGTLESALLDHRLDLADAARMVRQIGGALATAHAAGVVHRDVKSANVFLDGEGNHFLGDFGIAVDISAQGDPEASLSAGSPAYASPEQLRRLPVGPTADVHGLGIVLYEALTGHLPFPEARSHAELLQRQLHDTVPSVVVERPELDPAVDEVIARATAKKPHERFATVLELVEAFDDVVGLQPTGSRQSASIGALTTLGDGANPYKGLRAFQESDSDDFFGRDRLIDRLLDAMSVDGPESRFVAAVGPSGSGKSSVVRAGLLPRLRGGALAGSERWYLTTMTPGRDPFEELEAGLNRIATHSTAALVETMRADPRGIARAVKSALPEEDSELVLVIDQFEELFTLVDDDAVTRRFLEGLLSAAAEPRSQLRVVVTIRADFWDRPLRYPELARLLELSAVTVPPMAADELERAITDPAQRVGVAFEPGLVSVIMADVRDQPGSLPLMQYALTELYERRVSGLMRLEDYRDLGGVAGALARRAEELYSGGSEQERLAIRHLFTRLVTPGEGTEDTRRRAVRSELTRVPTSVIDRLGSARLLSFDRDPATREPTVEVAHEAIIRVWARLRTWLDEDRDGLRLARHLTTAAQDWEARGRPTDEVYRGGRLELVESWADGRAAELTDLESAFLQASIESRSTEEAAERRGLRRLRRLVAVTAVVAVLALIAGSVALFLRQRARDAEQEAQAERDLADAEAARADEQAALARDALDDAEAARGQAEAQRLESDLQRLAVEALSFAETDPELALLLAVEVARMWDDPRGLGALFEVLATDSALIAALPSPAGQNDSWVGWLDARTLVLRSATAVWIYDVDEQILLHEYRAPGAIAALGGVVAADHAGETFATLVADGTALVINGRDGVPTSVPVGQGALTIDIGPGDAFAVGYATGEVSIFGGEGFAERTEVARHPFAVTGLVWDADEDLMVSADSDHNVTVWSLSGGAVEALWTLTQHDIEAWREGSERVITINDVDSRAHGVIDGGPPEPDDGGPLDASERRVDVELSADADQVHVLIDPTVLMTLDVRDGAELWVAGGTLTRGNMRPLPDGQVLWQDRVVGEGGLVRQLGSGPGDRTALSPDGSVLASHGADGLTLSTLEGDRLLATAVARGCADWATLSPDGNLLASLVLNGTCPTSATDFGLFDTATGDRLDLRFPPSWMSFTEEGDFHHSSFGAEGRLENFLDPESQELLFPPLNPEDRGWGAFVVALDDRLYLADINDPEVRVYDTATGERQLTLTHPALDERGSGGLFYIDVNDSASLVAVGAGVVTVVWDAATGEPVATFEAAPDQLMTEVEFVGESRLLIVGSRQIEEVDVTSRQRRVVAVGVVQASAIYNANTVEVTDHGLTVLAGPEGLALYDSETWAPVGATIPSAFLQISASIAAGGDWAVTGSEEHFLVWNLDPDAWPGLACAAAGRNLTLDEWERFAPTGEEYRETCP